MDKYEYKLRLEEIKTLNKKGRFQESAQIADTIDWKKVRNTSTLGIISDVYKINRRFDDAREILLLANEKSPQNRRIVYALCDLAIKTGQVVEAVEYYKQFVQLSPNDNSKYILLYKIYEAQDISLEERIAVLKEYKKREYNEKWAYELAYLYHQAGMSEYARRLFGEYSPEAHQKYQLGDVNTTLIHTLKGKTIMLQYDISTPRPYSRLQTVCGTLGFAQKYPVPCIALDPNGDTPLEGELLEKMMARYKHPFNATIGEEAHRRGLPNEMNYVMDYRLIHCLRNGLPLDMDVYDAAEWSCITELSEKSVLNKSMAVEIPDFTRGAWKKYKY